jgi:CRP-like cAMP-binding protein
MNRFLALLALKKERREASFLLLDAGERYEAFLEDFADLVPRLPQYHIASYLGITPVALSRIRSRRAGKHAS